MDAGTDLAMHSGAAFLRCDCFFKTSVVNLVQPGFEILRDVEATNLIGQCNNLPFIPAQCGRIFALGFPLTFALPTK